MQNQDDSSLTDQKLLSRKKRYLSFPEGSILQVRFDNSLLMQEAKVQRIVKQLLTNS